MSKTDSSFRNDWELYRSTNIGTLHKLDIYLRNTQKQVKITFYGGNKSFRILSSLQ